MQKSKALILARSGLTTNLLYETLSQHFDEVVVILEQKESPGAFFKRRLKSCGLPKTLGQLLFLAIVPKLIRNDRRIKEILATYSLKGNRSPQVFQHVNNINQARIDWSSEELKADLIIVNGTRILSQDVLNNIHAPLFNIHTGITPMYRGVHGGYWALYNKDPEHFGVTLHRIDSGVDTGTIIARKTILISNNDNFTTYPILQYCAGLELLKRRIPELSSGNIATIAPFSNESRLYYHPTLAQYIAGRISKSVK